MPGILPLLMNYRYTPAYTCKYYCQDIIFIYQIFLIIKSGIDEFANEHTALMFLKAYTRGGVILNNTIVVIGADFTHPVPSSVHALCIFDILIGKVL